MTEEKDLYTKKHIEYLNMMFEVSTIANQTDDVYELLEKLAQHCKSFANVEETTISQKPGPTEETENPGPAGTETDSEHAFPTPGV